MRKKVNKKLIVALLSFVLLFGGTFGSSLAWLLAESGNVNNTFTTSDITVTLTETKPDGQTAKMVPGHTIEKDPAVAVDKDDEDCYLFVEIKKAGGVTIETTEGEGEEQTTTSTEYDFDYFLSCEIADGWTKLEDGVYYRIIDDASEKGTAYSVLANDQVTVNSEVTKDVMNALEKNGTSPALSFQAYAVQLWKTNKPGEGATDEQIKAAQFTADQAWNIANGRDADYIPAPDPVTP